MLSFLNKLLTPDGKLVISSLNTKYTFLIRLIEKLGLKNKNPINTFIHLKKIKKITSSFSLDYQKYYSKQIIPFEFFGIGNFINSFLEILFSSFNFGIKTYMIFRNSEEVNIRLSKSIIIPAKNEAGNLNELVSRIPLFENTEIIFAYGESQDDTYKVMQEISKIYTNFTFKIITQTKSGKANAVWEAIKVIENDLIAILDADISVEPETLEDFFQIIEENNADFINGTRLIYEMDKNSMRYINKVGNRFFQFFIGKIIKEPLTDSLCGTKVFKKEFISDIHYWQKIFWQEDPFGDFDLIFSAAYSGQKIAELPIRYRERRYGSTQISRFRDGYKLIKYLIASFLMFNTSINVKKF